MQVTQVNSVSLRLQDISSPGEKPTWVFVVTLNSPNAKVTEIEIKPSTAHMVARMLRTLMEVLAHRCDFDLSYHRSVFDVTYNVRSDGQVSQTELNLDCMPDFDLEIARDHPALHADIRRYAAGLLVSRYERKAGNIQSAIRMERSLERLYHAIPSRLQW